MSLAAGDGGVWCITFYFKERGHEWQSFLSCVGLRCCEFDLSHFFSRSVVMTSRVSSRVLVGVVAGLAVMACLASTAQARDTMIADWEFNDGALLADSSGNGHTLVQMAR